MRYSEIGFAGRLLLEKVDDLCRLDKRGIYVQNLDSWKLVREFIGSVQKYGIKPMACVAPPPGGSVVSDGVDELSILPPPKAVIEVPGKLTNEQKEALLRASSSGQTIIIKSELPPGLSFWQRLKFVCGG